MSDTVAKLAHLLPHWVEHNEAHMDSYRLWMARAQEEGLAPVADALTETVAAVAQANEALGQAISLLENTTKANEPSSFS